MQLSEAEGEMPEAEEIENKGRDRHRKVEEKFSEGMMKLDWNFIQLV